MTITVRQVRNGVAVRLTGAHARVFTGLLAELLGSDAPVPTSQQNGAELITPGADLVAKDAQPT